MSLNEYIKKMSLIIGERIDNFSNNFAHGADNYNKLNSSLPLEDILCLCSSLPIDTVLLLGWVCPAPILFMLFSLPLILHNNIALEISSLQEYLAIFLGKIDRAGQQEGSVAHFVASHSPTEEDLAALAVTRGLLSLTAVL